MHHKAESTNISIVFESPIPIHYIYSRTSSLISADVAASSTLAN